MDRNYRTCSPTWLLAMFVFFSASSCDSTVPGSEGTTAGPGPAPATVSGSVNYRERTALTDQARVEITLEDISRQDVAARIIARQTITSPGQVPIRFEIPYGRDDIDLRMSYAVRATIHDRGRLMFTSDTVTPVLTRGAGSEVTLMLVSVAAAAASDDQPPADSPGMELEGMFRYMADAARFRDCRTGKDFAVSMEGAYLELERAYSNSGIEPGSEIMARLRGRYLERPSMEENNTEVKLIVDELQEILPDTACAPTDHAALQNTYWKLLELAGRKVVTPEGMREAHVILSTDGSAARGHAGCNNFFGSFEAGEGALTFSALGSTMMACPEGMDTEQEFLKALGETTRYEISGQFLSLFADDRLLARLEAVYL